MHYIAKHKESFFRMINSPPISLDVDKGVNHDIPFRNQSHSLSIRHRGISFVTLFTRILEVFSKQSSSIIKCAAEFVACLPYIFHQGKDIISLYELL